MKKTRRKKPVWPECGCGHDRTEDGWCIVRGHDGRYHEIGGPETDVFRHGSRTCRDCGEDPWPPNEV